MILKVNGENTNLEKTLNVNELLSVLKVEQAEYVTVQLNGEFIKRGDFATTFIKEGDEVEFLYFMGGGQIGATYQ